MQRKGIILAGGSGTRLWPITIGLSKQLLPIYDKPMVYYPLYVLMLANIKEIALISTPQDIIQYERLLGNGNQWGINISYIEQPSPDGLAQAYILAEDFLDGSPSAMILGDNIFYGHGLLNMLERATIKVDGGTIFGYHVKDPERYGVMDFDNKGNVKSIVEKPSNPPSNYAITGLYFLDNKASERARAIKPSPRGELEITSLLEMYLKDESLNVEAMGRGIAWLDTGTHSSMLDASNFVRTITERQGMLVGSPDEIAYLKKWISKDQLIDRANLFKKNDYGSFLENLAKNK